MKLRGRIVLLSVMLLVLARFVAGAFCRYLPTKPITGYGRAISIGAISITRR